MTAIENFFYTYAPYDEWEGSLYNLKEIEKDLIANDTENEDPELWGLLQAAIKEAKEA